VPHPGGPKIAPLVDRLKEARGCSHWRTSRQLYRRAVCGAAGADGAHCGASRR
jgi:hypothetical protein